MMMAIYTSLRRIRPDHVNFAATRSLWHWHWQHPHRSIYGHHIYRLVSRHYVQAPAARAIPDDRSPPGLQQQQPQQQEQEQQGELPQQQDSNLSSPSQGENQSAPKESRTPDRQSPERPPSSSIMQSGVEIPYDISWIFPRLRNPSVLWYFTSQLVITVVGLFSKILLGLLNKTRVHHKERLVKAVGKRPKGIPLVTVSNHYSCFDDPGVWGLLPLRQVCNSRKIRWSMAAHDICFTKKLHSTFFMFGKCIPVVRGLGVYQDAINLCIEKCALGHWVHVFPEGKVNTDKEELRLKWGVGRIIYESPKTPIILPLWHEGMDDVLPNVEPYMLHCRKKVTVNVGQPLNLDEFVQDLKDNKVPEPVARKLITDKIQESLRHLRYETEKLHAERV